jgi:hypothetical protein
VEVETEDTGEHDGVTHDMLGLAEKGRSWFEKSDLTTLTFLEKHFQMSRFIAFLRKHFQIVISTP